MANSDEEAAQQVAEDLAQEVGEGFKSLGHDELASAWRKAKDDAPGERSNLAQAAREALQLALDRKHIKVYPSMGKGKHKAYRLYHKSNHDVDFLIDAITNLTEITDKMLEEFLAQEKVTGVITLIRRRVRN